MAFKAYQLTLAATPKQLSEVFGVGSDPATNAFTLANIPFRQLTFQLLTSATGSAFIGESSAMTTSVYGFRVDPADTAPPILLGPFDSGPMKLSDFWALGSAGEVLLISGITY